MLVMMGKMPKEAKVITITKPQIPGKHRVNKKRRTPAADKKAAATKKVGAKKGAKPGMKKAGAKKATGKKPAAKPANKKAPAPKGKSAPLPKRV